MFMVAFYGCLLAELIPVPIEVPLTRKVGKSIQHFHGLINMYKIKKYVVREGGKYIKLIS